jgi:hypothetical protein
MFAFINSRNHNSLDFLNWNVVYLNAFFFQDTDLFKRPHSDLNALE